MAMHPHDPEGRSIRAGDARNRGSDPERRRKHRWGEATAAHAEAEALMAEKEPAPGPVRQL